MVALTTQTNPLPIQHCQVQLQMIAALSIYLPHSASSISVSSLYFLPLYMHDSVGLLSSNFCILSGQRYRVPSAFLIGAAALLP